MKSLKPSKTWNVLALLVMAVCCFSFTNPFEANTKIFPKTRWENLGQRKVNFNVDRDQIVVTAKDGLFNAIKLKVKRGPIKMYRCVVHFGNGQKQEIDLRVNIPRGGETRVIDLNGGRRVIKKVVFWYESKPRAKVRAVVSLWGRHI